MTVTITIYGYVIECAADFSDSLNELLLGADDVTISFGGNR